MAKVLHQQQSVTAGSMEEKQHLDHLTQDIMNMNVEFVDFISKSKASKEYVTQRHDSINNDYNQRLMMMITMPLRRGCNKEAVLQSIGIAAGAMLFSKDFRKSCSATVQNVMYPYVSMLADRSKPGGFWDKQRQKLSVAEKGRLPFTPESAAVMHLGFCKNAYNRMREPGADRDQVLKEYKEAVQTLHSMARDDGISGEVLNQSVRTIAGQLIERDPKLAVCFEELSMRGVSRGQGKVENMHETWQGEYLDSSGKPYKGAFNPRIPRTPDEYGRVFSKFFSEQFKDCTTTDMLTDKMKSPELKQLCNNYVKFMLQDGMKIEDIRTHMMGYMRQGVMDWCDRNNIKTKASQKPGPNPQTKKPGSEPRKNSGSQTKKPGSGSKKNPGSKGPKSGPRPSKKPTSPDIDFDSGPVPEPVTNDVEFGG